MIGLVFLLMYALVTSPERSESFLVSSIAFWCVSILSLGLSVYWKKTPYIKATSTHLEINGGILNHTLLEHASVEFIEPWPERRKIEIHAKDGRIFTIRLKELSREDRKLLASTLDELFSNITT